MKKDLLISRLIVKNFFEKLNDALNVDVAIAGCGPSALALSIQLSKLGRKVAIFEARNEPGGGIWGGGMMFNELVVEEHLSDFLDELGVRYKSFGEFLVIDSVHFASALLYHSTKNGTLIFNNVLVEDLVVYENRVSGIVVNWAPTVKDKRHVDPISVLAKYTVDATGHPASLVNLLAKRALLKLDGPMYEFPMDAEKGEEFVVQNTKEIFPGLYVIGMAAVSVGSGPRMGPIFGGMIESGLMAAELIEEKLKNPEYIEVMTT
ncbi:sulfide-dependent adenosine diphosphate thiazole synthase [Pseudothermotoga sp.]